jgi:hypothetical protein
VQFLQIISGALLLFFGRKLFWLFAGTVGFYAGYLGAARFFGDQPGWWTVLIAVMAGMSSAILAVAAKDLVITITAFLAGGYLLANFVHGLALDLGPFSWFPFVTGGLAACFLVVFVLEWALILLSAFVGATIVTQATAINAPFQALIFVALLILGGGLQVEMLHREETPPADSTN